MSGGSGPGGGGKAENAGPSAGNVDDSQGTLGGLAQASAANAAVAEANSIAKAMELGVSPAQLAALETQMFDPQNMVAQVTAPPVDNIQYATQFDPQMNTNLPDFSSLSSKFESKYGPAFRAAVPSTATIEAYKAWAQEGAKKGNTFAGHVPGALSVLGPLSAGKMALDAVPGLMGIENEPGVGAIEGYDPKSPYGGLNTAPTQDIENALFGTDQVGPSLDFGAMLNEAVASNAPNAFESAYGSGYTGMGPSLNRSPSFDMGAVSQAGGGEDLQRLIALRRAMAQQAAKKIINVSNDVGLTPEDIQDILPPSTSTPPSGGGTPPSGGGGTPPSGGGGTPDGGNRPPKRTRPGTRPERVETAAERLVKVITAPKISRSISRPILKEAIKTGNIVGSDNQVDLVRALLNPPKNTGGTRNVENRGR